MPDLHIQNLTVTIDESTISDALSNHLDGLEIEGDIEGCIVNALEDIDIEELVKDEARDRIADLDIFEVFAEVMPDHFGPELEEIQGYLNGPIGGGQLLAVDARLHEQVQHIAEIDRLMHQKSRHIEELRDRLEALHSESVWSFLRRKIFGGRAW